MVVFLQSIVGALLSVMISLDIGVEGSVSHMGMKSSSFSALFIVAWSTMFSGVEANNDVEQHLDLGKKLLAAGQLADALSHYHAAVEGDPLNYMTYYRRATVFLAMGKSKSALPDLDKVIELKPDFTSARLQRANVKLKQGRLDDAEQDYKAVLQKDFGNEDASQKLQILDPIRTGIKDAIVLRDRKDYQGAIDIVSPIIEYCPWDPDLRELRADCYEAQGDYFKAVGDIRPTAKLRNDNTAAYYRTSRLLYEMGDAEESLIEIRECLKLDPDHKECFPHYKKVKKLAKQIGSIHEFISQQKWDDCISKVDAMLKTEPNAFQFVHKASTHKCHCYSKAKMAPEAFEACNKVIEYDENNIEAICDRAEAYIVNDQFEEAIKDFQRAEEIDNNYKRALEGVKRAQKLLKQSKKKKVPTATLR